MFHAFIVHRKLRFASLSQPTAVAAVYWMNASQLALLPPTPSGGTSPIEVTISLTETSHRAILRDQTPTPLETFELIDWMRGRICSWEPVTKAYQLVVSVRPPPSARLEPWCGALPASPSSLAYVALDHPESCNQGAACDGDALRHILNTSNEQRHAQRIQSKRFAHMLKPIGCRLRLFDEPDVTRCLAGRRLLNMGSDVAVDIQRGFGRLNVTLRAWTRRHPSELPREEAKLPFRRRRATNADWAYQFERTGGFNGRGPDVMAGLARFGRGSVGTQFLQHPPHYGLANMLDPAGVRANASGRVGFDDAIKYERYMCGHEIVVLESGLADFALAFNDRVTFSKNRVLPACAGRPLVECELALRPAIKGEDWRRSPMRSYLARLSQILEMWRRCRSAKPSFRAIFKLSPAPRARQRHADCEFAQWGFSSASAHYMQRANDAARKMVLAAGFEVFEGFALTLHAPAFWFDDARYGVRFKIHEAEALSDVLTQALLNQLCPP